MNFCAENRKAFIPSKSWWSLCHGRSCQEMCGTILWVSQQVDTTTLPSIYSMLTTIFKQELKSVGLQPTLLKSHFLFERALCYTVYEFFWFYRCPSVCNPFCSFSAFSWHVWATEQTFRYLWRKLLLRIWVLLMALAPTSMVWTPALEVQRMESSMLSVQNLYTSKRRSRKFLLSRMGCPASIHISRKHLETLQRDLQRWKRVSTPSLHVCAWSRQKQLQYQMYLVLAFRWSGWGLHSRMVPWPRIIWWQQKHKTKTSHTLQPRRRTTP